MIRSSNGTTDSICTQAGFQHGESPPADARASLPRESAPRTGESAPRASLALAGTFTIDPVVEALGRVLEAIELDLDVEVAPYGQVFQELLDPGRPFARNRGASMSSSCGSRTGGARCRLTRRCPTTTCSRGRSTIW